MKEKLTIKGLAKQIEEDNEKFSKMSEAEKRITIAKDCIVRIQTAQMIAKTGNVIKGYQNYWRAESTEKKISIKEVLNVKDNTNCSVCAKGGLFMSYIGRVNEFSFDDISNDTELNSPEMIKLQEVFEGKQLDLIETAFEQRFINYGDWGFFNDRIFILEEENPEFYPNSVITRAITYREDNDIIDDDKALLAICNNIIENKGEFIP